MIRRRLMSPPLVAVVLATALVASYSSTTRAAELRIEVLPNPVITAGDDFAVIVSGGTPGTGVELKASARDRTGGAWQARNAYIFDAQGRVDLTQQAPFDGSYQGVDGRGPFWSMTEVEERRVPWGSGPWQRDLPQFFIPAAGTHTVTLAATADDGSEARTEIGFVTVGRDIKRHELTDPLTVGTFYEPAAPSIRPPIIVVGGNTFGYRGAQLIAARLATRGYNALALAFSGVDKTPPRTVQIPLEYFEDARQWLAARPNIGSGKPALIGVGHNAGLALLLAARSPDAYGPVIAVSPHSVVFAIIRGGTPWTDGGELWPFVPLAHWDEDFQATGHFYFQYEKSLILYEDAVAEARIPVERIIRPVLLLSGANDLFQPGERMGWDIAATMTEAGRGDQIRHVVYPDAGNVMGGDGVLPTQPIAPRFGGTAAGTAAAQFQAWNEVFRFLDAHLR